ncbi:DUF3467 domain-containing protein [Patescibacteria group bacterium]|nr:DUF3467 domain-containing protein [Patescibacteria group bacterium]
MNDQPKKQKPLQVNIDPAKIESQYSDAAFIDHNPFGFTINFAQNIPQMNMLKIVSRISLSPQHAKALLNALAAQVKGYESKFGAVTLTPAMKEQTEKPEIGFHVEGKQDA